MFFSLIWWSVFVAIWTFVMLQFMVAFVKDLIDGKEVAQSNLKVVLCGSGILEELMFDFQYEYENWEMT